MKKFKPILFSTAMVQAILEGRKTQTRRLIKPQPNFDSAWKNYGKTDIPEISVSGSILGVNDGKGGVGCCVPNVSINLHKGDILWVRETWQYSDDLQEPYLYKEKELDELKPEYFKRMTWKPSIFMPKAACRIFLEVTNVRVERLQDISEEDAKAEGIKKTWIADREELCLWKNYINNGRGSLDAVDSFQSLWKSINGKESWDANPWIWVYDFKRVGKPENFLS